MLGSCVFDLDHDKLAVSLEEGIWSVVKNLFRLRPCLRVLSFLRYFDGWSGLC